MRQKLNENPVAQIALIGVLALVAGYFVLSGMGGGEEEAGEGEAGAPTSAVTGEAAEGTAGGTALTAPTAVAAPGDRSLPRPVEQAYERGETVVVLVVRDGGIDDRLVRKATNSLRGDASVALFIVEAKGIARYTPITGPLGVESAPALIVVRPKRFNAGGPAPATVDYGFRRADDVAQAIRDAVYSGPRLGYAPQ